jgi:hypothetical protein
MFLGEDLVEAGYTIQVKAMGVKGLVRQNNLRFLGFVLEESDSVEDVLSYNGNVDHPCKFFALGSHESGAVDNPVVLAATVETFFFPDAWASIFLEASFSPGTG